MMRLAGAILLAAAAIAASPLPVVAKGVQAAEPSTSTWPRVTQLAERGPRQFAAIRTGRFGGRDIRYRAMLSEMLVKDRAGKPASSLFVTAYVAENTAAAARPVVFLFNGGPGGSSNTLMFGAVGPERLARFDAAAMANPATPVIANPDTFLDAADLVFIDAPETGFGRPLPGSDPMTFRSNDGDANAFAQVILRWLTDHDRLGAPVFIAGESYGSIRAALLARDLRTASTRIELAGLILVSQALGYNGPDTAAIRRLADPVRAVSALPDIAALAWHHGLIDNRRQTLEQAVRAAERFALHDYAPVMLAGNRATAASRARIAAGLAGLTGIAAQHWLDGGLRIDNVRRQLLAGRGRALGQFDGRETEPLAGVVEDSQRDFKQMMIALTNASEALAARTFRAVGLPEYRSIVPDPYGFEKTWTYIAAPAPGADVVLREQIAANPRLRLMVTQGVYDTTTTMGETDYLFGQIGAPPERTVFARYAGGHMLYSDDEGRRAFLDDVRAFVTGRNGVARPFPDPAPAARP